jgi:folylpolyglutamate synthase/dihydropteroate synthase
MKLKNIIAVSGMSGLYKLVTTKTNGLVVADMDSGKTTFCSVRQHQFTPMETVAIYTDDDSKPIAEVFQSMIDHLNTTPVPSSNAAHNELKKYFEIIMPEYDRDRVFHSDMKKVIKWFNFLNERGLLKADDEIEKSEEE